MQIIISCIQLTIQLYLKIKFIIYRNITFNLFGNTQLTTIFLIIIPSLTSIFSVPYLEKGEKTKRVRHRLMTHPPNLPKQQTLSDNLSSHFQKGQTPPAQFKLRLLPWSHYERLIRVEDKKAREWYAKEAFEQGWSYRTLNRNINTLYYERLLMSKDKAPVEKEMKEKTNEFQQDKLEYIKSPVVMEFLGLPSDSSLKESKLESAIIDNLEKFLMEMGKGYALVARQQHIRTEENDYYIDLVFYNYLIKSFILVDLKVNRITYQDVGQMDMYLQMYDKMKKGPDDNPTIGIILCTETDSDVARYSTLAKNDQMFAAKYKLYLPNEEDLRREIERQKELYLMAHPEENDKE